MKMITRPWIYLVPRRLFQNQSITYNRVLAAGSYHTYRRVISLSCTDRVSCFCKNTTIVKRLGVHIWIFIAFFYCTSEKNRHMTPSAHCGGEDSVRLLLNKNPARSFSCPWSQVHRLWQLARHRAPPVCRHWCASTVTSDEPTRSWSKPPAHGVNHRVPLGLESHFGPVRHEGLYRIALRIIDTHKPYHDDNVGVHSAGNFYRIDLIFDRHKYRVDKYGIL